VVDIYHTNQDEKPGIKERIVLEGEESDHILKGKLDIFSMK
jgi:hypothetical protein